MHPQWPWPPPPTSVVAATAVTQHVTVAALTNSPVGRDAEDLVQKLVERRRPLGQAAHQAGARGEVAAIRREGDGLDVDSVLEGRSDGLHLEGVALKPGFAR